MGGTLGATVSSILFLSFLSLIFFKNKQHRKTKMMNAMATLTAIPTVAAIDKFVTAVDGTRYLQSAAEAGHMPLESQHASEQVLMSILHV